ncbi:MAG TPA: transcription elongation factor GreA [Actinomycetota bacterium]|nr:transcription elongation factor GreA [Actinomycetota bacterium]
MADEKKKVPLTKAALERVTEELANREDVKRPEIVEAIATARAHGDLSENAEYHAARDQQGFNESEIRRLRSMLENAEVIQTSDDDVVGPGKLVSLRYQGDDDVETYLLGLQEEKGGEHDILTPESPLGRALVGRSVGDTVVAQVPAGELKVEIVEVKPA